MQEQVKDVYAWKVIYTDGTSTPEYDEARPDGRGWAEKEAKPVQAITLARVSDGTTAQSIGVPEGAEPVFFRRRSLMFGLMDGSTQQSRTVHCIGWKCGDEAEYLFVYDSGDTLHTNDLQAV